MLRRFGIFSVSFLVANLAFSEGLAPKAKLVGSISVAKPAFLKLLDGQQPGAKELISSAFAVFGTSTLSHLAINAQGLSNLSLLKPQAVTTKINWPNGVNPVPQEIFGESFVAVGSGFLTPGSNTGAVSIANIYSGELFQIAATKKDYFYHRVLFADLNGDGLLDAVTARAKKPLLGASDGEIIWLEQPIDNKKGLWKEHLIAKGPDTHFILHDLDNDGVPEVISTEFFGRKLSIQWLEAGVWQSKVLDSTLGNAFDLSMADLNGDGKLDLLVTNHESSAEAAIFAYEIPLDFKSVEWTRHTLLTDIKTEKQGPNQGSPGSAYAVQPIPAAPLKKPWIIAGGDGSTKVHRLVAKSDDSHDWTYEEDIILDIESTIGQISFGDADGDGRLELFVPAYEIDKIFVFHI